MSRRLVLAVALALPLLILAILAYAGLWWAVRGLG